MSEKRDWLSSTQDTALLVCPFFVAHGDMEIKCEGLIDRTCTKISFTNKADKKFHQLTYCENQYKRCEMYCSILHWKWPEEE